MPDSPGFPDYKSPPVTEVAAGIQFAPLVEFTTAHVGLYWDKIRKAFPRVEEQGPIAHIVEPVGHQPSQDVLKFEVANKPPLPRTWLIAEAGTSLIQVQRDRFLYNWRKMTDDDRYIRFSPIKQNFFDHWRQFCDFLRDCGLSSPDIDQCELTYVNRIDQGAGWKSVADLEQLFTNFAWRPRGTFLPEPEDARWGLRFVLPAQLGRLYAEAVQVRASEDNSVAIRFSLTVRGLPAVSDEDSISTWFDVAHEWIVKGFVALTAEETDALWQREQ